MSRIISFLSEVWVRQRALKAGRGEGVWIVQGHGGQGARERAEGATPRPAGVQEAPPYPRLGTATSTTRPAWLVSPHTCLRPLQRVA